MAAKKPLPDRVQLKGLDSLFGIDQEQTGQVLEVPIRELSTPKLTATIGAIVDSVTVLAVANIWMLIVEMSA